MYARKIFIGLALTVLMAGLAFGRKVRTDYDHNVNFSKYRTFTWINEPNAQNPFMNQRMINAINGQLAARGLASSNRNADLAVSASFTTHEEQIVNTFYSGGGWGWGWGGGAGWATTTVETREIGTLVVDLLDAKTKQPLWRGVAVHSVSSRPDKASEKFRDKIREMFEEFPFC